MPPLKPRTLALLALLAALLLAYVAAELTWPTAFGKDHLTDFDIFHLAGRMTWAGDLASAYDPERFQAAQATLEAHGPGNLMFWSYPPPFDLVVAALAPLPIGAAYLLFVGGTLLAFLWVLRRLAGPRFHLVLLLSLPLMLLVARCGQNGFLTGALAGLACLLVLSGRGGWGGAALGAMVVKPHLALGLGLTLLLRRRWWPAAASAVGTALLLCLLSAAVLGWDAWRLFLDGMGATGGLLAAGAFSLFHMSSAFAALSVLGLPPGAALLGHAAIGAALLGGVMALRVQGQDPRTLLGFGLCASALLSPYAYAYDAAMLAMAAALLAEPVLRLASRAEQALLAAAYLFAGSYGLLVSFALDLAPTLAPGADLRPAPLIGPVLLLAALLLFRVLRRAAAPAARGALA